MGKGPGTSSSNGKDKQEVAPGKQNVTAACLKDTLEFKFFFESSYLRISYDMFNTSIDMVITDHMIQTSQGFFNI